MRKALILHPDSRRVATTGIVVEVARPRPGNLALRYIVTGNLTDLRMPPLTAPERADGLWRQTCFEAFVRAAPDAAYYEFNFAPSTQWAAYRFSGYRSGMSVADGISAPRIEGRSEGGSYELQASLEYLCGKRCQFLGRADDARSFFAWALESAPEDSRIARLSQAEVAN